MQRVSIIGNKTRFEGRLTLAGVAFMGRVISLAKVTRFIE